MLQHGAKTPPRPGAERGRPLARGGARCRLACLEHTEGSAGNFLRCQNNKTNDNLVCELLQFLDIMCSSTTGRLGPLGLYINERNGALLTQTLETLTEHRQGPCHENQDYHQEECLRGTDSTFAASHPALLSGATQPH